MPPSNEYIKQLQKILGLTYLPLELRAGIADAYKHGGRELAMAFLKEKREDLKILGKVVSKIDHLYIGNNQAHYLILNLHKNLEKS